MAIGLLSDSDNKKLNKITVRTLNITPIIKAFKERQGIKK